MKMYTAGYTGHDGYPATLAEGDSIEEVIAGLPFDVDVSDLPKNADKVAIHRIVEAIQKQEGSSGWVRQAPYTVVCGVFSDPEYDDFRVSSRVSGASTEDVVATILRRSEKFLDMVAPTYFGGYGGSEFPVKVGARTVLAHVSYDEYKFSIVGVSSDGVITPDDLASFAVAYASPEDDVSDAYTVMAPTTEVEHATRMVAHYEEERLKAVRRAADDGVPQRVLASLTGVSQATVGRWLKDD